MTRTITFLLLAFSLFACGGTPPAGPNATPLQASVVLEGQETGDVDSPETITQSPNCMGVAVAPDRILTAAHCPPAQYAGAYIVVDESLWRFTAQGHVLADPVRVVNDVLELRPRYPLGAWIGQAAPAVGLGTFVVVRDSELYAMPANVDPPSLTGDVHHGDSGAGVFQGGRLVGTLQTCSTLDAQDGETCDTPGHGDFTPSGSI